MPWVNITSKCIIFLETIYNILLTTQLDVVELRYFKSEPTYHRFVNICVYKIDFTAAGFLALIYGGGVICQ